MAADLIMAADRDGPYELVDPSPRTNLTNMNRMVLTIILTGSMILVANLLFYFIPITIFPCTLTGAGHVTKDSVCSLGYVYGTQEYVVAKLTAYGELLQFVVTGIMPIVAAILIVFRRRNSSTVLRNHRSGV